MTRLLQSERTAGGVRPISPARRCPYCGRVLTRWCQAKKVYQWGPIRIELVRTICRTNGCQERARKEGFI